MNQRIIGASVLLALALLGGCGSDSEGSCDSVASSLCDRYAGCEPFAFRLAYGDRDHCVAYQRNACQQRLDAPGSRTTAASEAACADQLTCEDMFSGHVPDACKPVAGTKANGESCYASVQCQSTGCQLTTSGGCGTCQPRPGEGEPCASGACLSGLLCNVTGRCVRVPAYGEPCDESGCVSGYICGKERRCEPVAKQKAGESCLFHDDCDQRAGLLCASNRTCTEIKIGSQGQSCGLVDGDSVYCDASTMCGSGTTCEPLPDEGEPCTGVDPSTPACRKGLRCEGGTCALASVPSCH